MDKRNAGGWEEVSRGDQSSTVLATEKAGGETEVVHRSTSVGRALLAPLIRTVSIEPIGMTSSGLLG